MNEVNFQANKAWGSACLWLAFLGPFFYLTYGFANWLANQQTNVDSVVFAWEYNIPFMAWTIIPYWSINLFYAASLFVCANPLALNIHVKRLVTAQIIAVSCFILLPLHFTFDRPTTSGLPGLMFDALASFDKPFNQAPSLHIALAIILWVLYIKHLPNKYWHYTLHLWFSLVVVSVLTTFQHHFIDIPTGALLGWFCVWLWPDNNHCILKSSDGAYKKQRYRLGTYYLLGALLPTLVAILVGGASLWLLWVSTALTLVASCYFFIGVDGFQKQANGQLSLAARWLLFPYLIGAFINSRLWTRKQPAPVQVYEQLWLGRFPSNASLISHNFQAVVDLSAEMTLSSRSNTAIKWYSIPCLDLIPPTAESLYQAITAIDKALKSGKTLVCCALGYSRSVAALAAWLEGTGQATNTDSAISMIKLQRPEIVINEVTAKVIHHAATLYKDNV
ncbi:phosphatase PAP2/dual specificity phosphatase family protein [Spartinivicinus ruber]|uniref:phosphatase PAP2/dual specificity phosphatase family protein n=1 Tax=Spartinivicinus ruber TaxID=2683272 RepID=UPI0013D6CA69|nr:phosphatase PAP2/dual specificity phosphatase family protein [Spartinivicinus ruber]